jgi:cyclohexanone monooxygenase
MATVARYDVLVVGAGFAGMYALYRFRQLGLAARVLEAGADVGGTWYWNRYPGARCDVPAIEYSYSFSKELEQDWNWSEWMAAQPEILAYANHVADRFDLRRDIEFGTRVVAAHFDDDESLWRVETQARAVFEARFCVMGTGCLSVPNTPSIAGAHSFGGRVIHTGAWPREGVDFSGRRVGLIGTGSSGVQSVPVIAAEAAHLTVFQRTPNYTLPANNQPLDDAFRAEVKAAYPDIRAKERTSPIGVIGFRYGYGGRRDNEMPTGAIMATTREERLAALDEEGFRALYRYADHYLSPEANELACEMYREQVRRVVKDPATAEALSPRGYPMGCKRPVLDIDYFEAFNRDNVTLVDLRRGAIEAITPAGLRTEQGDFEFDDLVYATGFDAMTGALLAIDIRGRGGRKLGDHWVAGPRTYLGLAMHGFPNLFAITGPGSPSVLSNMICSIEQHVDWIGDCLGHLRDGQLRTIEADAEAEEGWIAHVNAVANGTMLTAPSCNSWYLGANIPGKPRIFMPYVGGVGVYREKCDQVARDGYPGFVLAR